MRVLHLHHCGHTRHAGISCHYAPGYNA
jgi:hypothetical protein